MNRYSNYSIAIAICLSALAGYVDAVGFLQLGGYFISFMSGNSTRLAVGLLTGDWLHAILIGTIICFFVTGALLGTVVGHLAGEKQQPFVVLLFVTLLLTVAILCYEAGFAYPAIMFMTLAMGFENTIFQRDGEIVVGLTYMTGTLVKVGQRIGQAFCGGNKLAWVPYLLLWLGLMCGGATGVALFSVMGLNSLWIAISWSAVLAFMMKHNTIHA